MHVRLALCTRNWSLFPAFPPPPATGLAFALLYASLALALVLTLALSYSYFYSYSQAASRSTLHAPPTLVCIVESRPSRDAAVAQRPALHAR